MFSWLQKLMPWSSKDSGVKQLEQFLADVRADSTGFSVADLRPVLVPSAIFEAGRWIGPYHHFPALPVSLTWAFLRPQQTMLYLAHDAAAALEAKGIDWRSTARATLVKEFERHPWTHEYRNDRGKVEGMGMIHEDGLGPSRLIMYSRFAQQFPQGFSFFVPERSCAIVIANDASSQVRAAVEAAVRGYFSAADVPMSESAYDHTLLRRALSEAHEGA